MKPSREGRPVLGSVAALGARVPGRQGAGNVGAVIRQPEHGEIGIDAGGKRQLEGAGAIAAFQRLGEGGEFGAFRWLEQLAGRLADQGVATFLDQVIGGAGGEQDGASRVHLEQEIGVGEGEAQETDRQGHGEPSNWKPQTLSGNS